MVTALIGAGLQLSHLAEYNFCNGFKPMSDMVDLGGRRYAMPAHLPQDFPLMFSLVAEETQ